MEEWLTVQGTVVSVDASALTVELDAGELLAVEGRAWRFAQEQGFSVQAGDEVRIVGFDEDGEFKPGQIENITTQTSLLVREESGRPLWAGGGRRGS